VLYLVLTLVITAFALLVAALTTANTVWAWVSVAISVVAAGLLVFDWLRGRRRVAATSAPRAVDQAGAGADDTVRERPGDVGGAPWAVESPETTATMAAVQAGSTPAEPLAAVDEDRQEDSEPGEEATDATDLLVISELAAEVQVVDEHPRYHLARCGWLTGRSTISLAVSEARQLGFTPCARCGPDAVLAARHRNSRGASH
jgi:membrane protein implicated in regulation of membrane protease activity